MTGWARPGPAPARRVRRAPRAYRRLLALLPALAALPALGVAPVAGQLPGALRWEVEASATRLQYDTLDALDAPGLNALLEWESPTVLSRLVGGVTRFQDAGWTV
ncbi:MAG: hypothetical protein RQ751_13855, partial [Longimicrobiales bacterium]|nr:hypothetical protein [Longimicrobiales bacterium]